MILKKILLSVLGLGMMVTMGACSVVNTQPDEEALHYSGGSFSSANFKGCVESSTRNWDGPGDNHYKYPKGQRTFSFTGAKGSEAEPIAVTTNDGQTLSVPGFVTFTLNTDCKTLREFHERVGIKYKAYQKEGWEEFLNDYILVPLTAAMNKASLDTDWRKLYSVASQQANFEEYVKENLPSEVEKALGDDFLTINAVQISKPIPEAGLLKGLAAKEEARLQNDAQLQRNTVAATKYDSMKQCRQTGLSETACLTMYLADESKIPFYPVPQGGSVMIQPHTTK